MNAVVGNITQYSSSLYQLTRQTITQVLPEKIAAYALNLLPLSTGILGMKMVWDGVQDLSRGQYKNGSLRLAVASLFLVYSALHIQFHLLEIEKISEEEDKWKPTKDARRTLDSFMTASCYAQSVVKKQKWSVCSLACASAQNLYKAGMLSSDAMQKLQVATDQAYLFVKHPSSNQASAMRSFLQHTFRDGGKENLEIFIYKEFQPCKEVTLDRSFEKECTELLANTTLLESSRH